MDRRCAESALACRSESLVLPSQELGSIIPLNTILPSIWTAWVREVHVNLHKSSPVLTTGVFFGANAQAALLPA